MVGGFRIERLIGTGTAGAVYEATQVSLGRLVALRVIGPEHFRTPADLQAFDEQQRRMASLHHPNLVPCYAAGEWEGGRYVAMRYIRGASLSQLLNERVAPAAEAIEPLVGALAAAHDAGLIHGRVSAQNILVEANGTPYLTDFGLARAGSEGADRDAMNAVISDARAAEGSARQRRHRTRPLALATGCMLAAIAVLMVLLRGGGDSAREALEPLGCSAEPTANTPSCTLAQTRLDGDPAAIKRAGVIRGWAVSGASGILELQVIRHQGDKDFVAGYSQPAPVSPTEQQVFPASIAVRPGDLVGVRLSPGATIGSRPGVADSSISQWDGGLTAERRPSTGVTNGVEMMLRTDVESGARVDGPRQLLGAQAAQAPRGRVLSESPLTLPVGVRVVVVSVSGVVAIDVFGDGRLARLEIPDADPNGELVETTANCGPAVPGGFCLRWRNPGTSVPFEHQYIVKESGRIHVIG